ncbi:MAG: NAD(P)/FAD-dependent oxidoreductase [Nitritalea sp.]
MASKCANSPNSAAPILIIGGGIIGLYTAYYLHQMGREVILLDRNSSPESTSTGNAGMVVPSHIVPLAAPGMIEKGIRWMFSPKSPFYIHPSWNWQLLDWALRFRRAATAKQVQRAIPHLKNISLLSLREYQKFFTKHAPETAAFTLQQKGLLMLYQTAAMEKEELTFGALARQNGIEAHALSPADIAHLEPGTRINARGGILFPGDAHLDPAALMQYLRNHLRASGILLHTDTEVLKIERSTSGQILRVHSRENSWNCSSLVLCGGAWTSTLTQQLGLKLPLLGGKGYSFLQTNPSPGIRQAAILCEAKVAVSPYGQKVRFGGTLEIQATTDNRIRQPRVQGIYEAARNFYPEFPFEFPKQEAIWTGHRPCSPDGMPYIGALPGSDNAFVGTGHGMMGVSMAPATGLLLAEKITGKSPSISLEAFHPGRFARKS